MLGERTKLTDTPDNKIAGKETNLNFDQYILGNGIPADRFNPPTGLPNASDLLAYVGVGGDEKGDKKEKKSEGEKKDEAKEKTEKKKPKDGDVIPLAKLLKEYDTPFNDAYKNSKRFKALVDRMLSCPWADQLKVRFNSKALNPDYDPSTSTITLNSSDPPRKQIEMFAHESYHATNARLHKLYLSEDIPKTKEGRRKLYVELMSAAEVEAFKAEIDVHRELKHPGTVKYKYVDKDNKKAEVDLATIYDGTKKGGERLAKFLLDEAKTVMSIDGKRALHTYREYYESAAKAYETNLEKNQENLRAWVRSTPGLAKKLKDGDY